VDEQTGVALRDPLPWHDFTQVVVTVEDLGFDGLFLPEIVGRESFSTLAALAGETAMLRLGTGIVTMSARRPLTTAMAAATVDERSGGRFILGLGSGPGGPGALDKFEEYVGRVRSLLEGAASGAGAGDGVRLALPPAGRVPIWIAALGPRSMRLAGEIGDGVLLNWCPPERVAFARERVREGAESADRDPDGIEVAVYVRACVAQDEDLALASLRRAAGEYASIPAYRRQFDAVGLGAESGAAAAAHRDGRPDAVPEGFVRALCLLGDAAEALAGLRAYREAGADVPIVYPVAGTDPVSSVLGTLYALAPHQAVDP
jgi:5,10-methylenetetrahydromethanopterin reductase